MEVSETTIDIPTTHDVSGLSARLVCYGEHAMLNPYALSALDMLVLLEHLHQAGWSLVVQRRGYYFFRKPVA